MAHLCLVAAVSGLSIGAYVVNIWALVSASVLILAFGSAFDLLSNGHLDTTAMMRWVAVFLSMQLGYLVGAMTHHLIDDDERITEEDEPAPLK